AAGRSDRHHHCHHDRGPQPGGGPHLFPARSPGSVPMTAATVTPDLTTPTVPRNSLPRVLWQALLADKLALVALIFILVLLFAAIFAPVVAPHEPEIGGLMQRNKPPLSPNPGGGFPHLLGTDQLGRDLFTRLL